VKRQLGLGQAQLIGELADAPFSLAQGLDHLQPDRIGQSLEQRTGLITGQATGLIG